MKDFGMFTPEGNAEVGKIIEKAKTLNKCPFKVAECINLRIQN